MLGYFLKFLFSLTSFFLISAGVAESKENYLDQALQVAKTRCLRSSNKSFSSLKTNDFKWNINLFEMKKIFNNLYKSPKRLLNYMYYDPKQNNFKIPYNNEEIIVPENFIKNIILHVEVALQKNYSDYINFSDMGHLHFLIPRNHYKKHIAPIKKNRLAYQEIMNFKKTKFIYHTAEQLLMRTKDEPKLLDDPYIQYRYLNRNIVGDNEFSGDLQVLTVENPRKNKFFNTVRNLENYFYWGNGPYLHSSKQSCIPYKKEGKVLYFDMNLSGLVYDNTKSGAYF